MSCSLSHHKLWNEMQGPAQETPVSVSRGKEEILVQDLVPLFCVFFFNFGFSSISCCLFPTFSIMHYTYFFVQMFKKQREIDCISVIESNITFPCYLGKCHAASTEGIIYAALYTWILVRLYTYLHFLRGLLTCGKLSFLRRIFTIVPEGQKECWSSWCKRGLSVLKVVCANSFVVTDLKTIQSFWNISDPLFSLFGVFGKMKPPSLLLHVPFSSTFRDTLTCCRSLSRSIDILAYLSNFFRNLIRSLILIQFWFIQATWLT